MDWPIGENDGTTYFKHQLKSRTPPQSGKSFQTSNLFWGEKSVGIKIEACNFSQAKSPKSKPCASWGNIGTTSTTNASAATLISPAGSQPRRFSVSEICLEIFLWVFRGEALDPYLRESYGSDMGMGVPHQIFPENKPFGKGKSYKTIHFSGANW